MSQPFDPKDFLNRLVRNEVSEAELINLVTAGHALAERRNNAARRRVVELADELDKLRGRLEELHGASGSLMFTREAVVVELAQIDFDTKACLTELNLLLMKVPGLHDEALDRIANEHEEADAEQPKDTAPDTVAEDAQSALDGGSPGYAQTPLVGEVNTRVYINLTDADPQAAAEAINAFFKGGEVKT